MPKQELGITLIVPPGQEATGVYEDPEGVQVFETDTPYVLSDGKSLSDPLPVKFVPGPVFTDSLGNAQAALPVSGAEPSFDPDAEALIARFAVQPDEDRKILIDETIVALKNAGIWDKMEVLYILAAHDGQAARQNWKADAFNATAYNSPAFAVDRGYTGDGSSSYLDSGFTPAISSVLFEANSNHAAVWIGTDIGNNTMTDFGYPRNAIVSRSTIGAIIRNSSTGSDSPILPEETSIGWTCTSRGTSLEYAFQKDDYPEVVIPRSSSAHDPDDTMMLLCRSAQPLSNTAYSARRLQACHWGAYLTEAERSDLYAILLNYMTAVGAV